MQDWLRRAGMLALALAFTAYAYAPLMRAGFVGEDFATLTQLASMVAADSPLPAGEDLYGLSGLEARPGGAFSLLVSAWLWADGSTPFGATFHGGEARWFRAENLALLILAAAGLWGLLRRALAPWVGLDQAKAAGLAAAVIFLLHPLCVASVARIASRGELLAVAAGVWSARLFLRGRQESQYSLVGSACLLAIVAGLASKQAVFLPFGCALLEFMSARRHRPRLVRLRTAGTTFFVFFVAVGLEWLGRLSFAPAVAQAAARGVDVDPLELGVEKLGVLFLPVDTYGIGPAGYLLAGLAVLLALHPGFIAARAAPRLWGRILVGWLAWVAATEAMEPRARVVPETLEGAHVLFTAALVMAVGFGTSSTAISGARRSALPALIAIFYALLAHAAAVPLERASAELEALRAELFEQARQGGGAGGGGARGYLLVDPPAAVAGVDALGPALEHLLDPAFLPADVPALEGGRSVRGIAYDALLAYLREPEFAAWRARGAALLIPGARMPGTSTTPDTEQSAGRVAVHLPAPFEVPAVVPERPTDGRPMWRGTGQSPGLDLDALRWRWIHVAALPDARTAEPPVVRWTASSKVAGDEEVVGAWIASDSGPVAVFDLESSLAWLLGDRIHKIWFQGPLGFIDMARVATSPDDLAGDPAPVRAEGTGQAADWLFEVAAGGDLEPLGGEATWVLGLLDLDALDYVEFVLSETGGRLHAPGIAARVDRMLEQDAGAVVWYLDRRVDGVTVARASGRRLASERESTD